MRRGLLGLSLSKLANASGISAPQLMKYENGVNRISASRLSDLATLLGILVADLFPLSSSRPPHRGLSIPPN
jgi:transcriptional regulator with XRE-family HTH domain